MSILPRVRRSQPAELFLSCARGVYVRTHSCVLHRVHRTRPGAYVRTPVILLALAIVLAGTAAGQVVDSTAVDTVEVAPSRVDSLRAAPSLGPGALSATGTDTSGSPVAPRAASNSGLRETVQFSSRDSTVIVFGEDGGDKGSLFGTARVQYGDATLEAHQVDILFDIDELRASGLPADTGMIGRPSFQQGSDAAFSGDRLAFNLRTERGRVVGAQTVMEDGFIRGQVVKVTEDSTLFIQGGLYTTCECVEDPSYSLQSDRMKIVDEKWVYTGPIQLYIFNIPTPLWLPFGFLPATTRRTSGLLPPRYGEDSRGFYLDNWGWYFAINDYLDAQIQFGIWTRGSWRVSPSFRYNKRYRYSGSLGLDYIRNRNGEHGDPDFTVVNTSSLRWTHNQTISPTARFSSNVNLSSSSYLRTISRDYDDRVSQSISSSISYSKRWDRSSRALSLNLSQQQVLATGQTSITLPNLTFSQGSRKPFARDIQVGRERWYEKITYSYSGSLQNRYNFTRLPDATLDALGLSDLKDLGWFEAIRNPSKYRLATGRDELFDFSARHSIPVSASFQVNRIPIINKTLRLNFSTSVSYNEDWHISTFRKGFVQRVDTTGEVPRIVNRLETRPVQGFFSERRFSSSISASTTVYGLFPVRVGPLSGFRHTVRPSIGMSFAPDFTSDFWGYTRTYEDTLKVDGKPVIRKYNIVNGQDISPYGSGRQQSLNFSLDNVFETKVVRRDSTGEEKSEVLKLLDVDVRGSYNFAADSLKFSSISLSARTNLFNNRLNLSFRSSFSPYEVTPDGRLIDDYVFSPLNFKFARLERMDISAQTSFRSRGAQGGRPVSSSRVGQGGMLGPDPYGNEPYDPNDPLNLRFGTEPVSYADFAIPWSIRLDFTYSKTNRLGTVSRGRSMATLNAAFDFNLTPNWKVEGRTGYDFMKHDLVTTSINVYRDFECWQMSFNWYPFGEFQSYGFDLHVKSGKLRDLLRIRSPRADVRRPF